MRYPSRLLLLVVCLFACLAVSSPAKAQALPPFVAFFSTGQLTSPSQVWGLRSDGSTWLLMQGTTASPGDYEGLVVLPDNTGNATNHFLLYACDPKDNQALRLDPYNLVTPPETFYNGGAALQGPQCGRGATTGDKSTGDLIVTSTVTGKNGGWWSFSGISNIALGSAPAGTVAPHQLFVPSSKTSTLNSMNAGMAVENEGDLLVVDTAGQQVLRSPGPTSSTVTGLAAYSTVNASPFISGLTSPLGIARDVSGELFVSSQAKKPFVTKFDVTGKIPTACAQFGNNHVVGFLQSSLDSKVWVADTTQNGTGEILELNASDCSVANTFSFTPPAVGLALPPTSASVTGKSNDGGNTWALTLGDSSELQVVTGGSCANTPTATATQTAPFDVQTLINEIPTTANALTFTPPENGIANGGTPGVDIWADGFEVVFDADFSAAPASCSPIGGPAPPVGTGTYEETMSSFVDPSVVTSGTVAYCDSALSSGKGGCDTVDLFGAYPYGGLLPQDYSGSGRTNSQFFVINATPFQTGQFCGYQSPLNGPTPPGIAGIFSTGSTISVKFKLATAGGSCKSASTSNYITNAVALISVAQLCTPGPAGSDAICALNNQAVLNPSNLVSLVPEGNSTQTPPEFKYGNNQYQFSLSLKGYPPGIYSLTTTFLSGDTTDQTVLFQVQ